ncbi:MAG: hypothetical protein QOF55_2608 [Thermoleophilaceae bacterium]|nr:hypothetical protein [Thermoleophilaceae bacterium]
MVDTPVGIAGRTANQRVKLADLLSSIWGSTPETHQGGRTAATEVQPERPQGADRESALSEAVVETNRVPTAARLQPRPADREVAANAAAWTRLWRSRRALALRRRAGESGYVSIREGQRARVVLARDAYFRRALASADALAFLISLTAVTLAAGSSPRPEVLLILPLMVLLGKVAGLYDRDEHVIRKTTLDEAPGLLQTATVLTLVVWLLDGVLTTDPIAKRQVVALWALLLVSMMVGRAVARRLVLHLTPAERCVVLGDSAAALRVSEKFSLSHSMKAVLVGRVRIEEEKRAPHGPEVLGPLEDLDFILRSEHIDRVIIAPHSRDSDETLDTIRLVKALGVKVSVLPRLFEVIGSSVEFDDCDGITLLGVRRYGLSKSSTLLKRAFDIAGSVAGVLMLAPLFAAIAVAIKVTSRGPVFFRQERIGRGGTTFRMFKFRTMIANAEAAKPALLALNEASGIFKISEDPRLTRVGRLLRRCSLDELPQLLNVILGEMSLVGPRPLVPEEDSQIEGWQRRRLDVTPGMTGVWQVLGSSRVPLHEMVKVDYIYRANWSIWLDIKILLRTVPLVLMRRNV